jgi:hypothetical protein
LPDFLWRFGAPLNTCKGHAVISPKVTAVCEASVVHLIASDPAMFEGVAPQRSYVQLSHSWHLCDSASCGPQ